MVTTTMTHDDSLREIIRLIENSPDRHSVLQLIRMSRMWLGSALDRLEDFEPTANAVEQLYDHAERIANEIDGLLRTIQEFHGH